jgi:hypothetical protein
MGAVEFRVWSTYAAQAKDHRERAARFRRYADETSNSKNRETYLRVVKVEENLAATAERLGKEFQTDAEGLDLLAHSRSDLPCSDGN